MPSVPEPDFTWFPAAAKFSVYQHIFCKRFAALAPEAWRVLLEMEGDSLEFFKTDPDSEERRAVDYRLYTRVGAWIEAHGLACRWIRGIVESTLIALALAEAQGTERPATLVQALEGEPRGAEQEGSWYEWSGVDVEPFAAFTFPPPPEPAQWSPLEETEAQFIERATESYRDWLRRGTKQALEINPLEPIAVHAQWVNWLILQRACGRSVNSIAIEYGKTRPAIDHGIEEARKTLGMEHHRATPPRFRGEGD